MAISSFLRELVPISLGPSRILSLTISHFCYKNNSFKSKNPLARWPPPRRPILMQCKNHPNKRAQHLCAGCGIPLCDECAEETKPGQFYCFQCAMLSSVSAVGTSIKGKRDKATEETVKKKAKLGAFHYFVIGAGVLILAMWGFILFGAEKPPTGTVDVTQNSRVLLFLGTVPSSAMPIQKGTATLKGSLILFQNISPWEITRPRS